MGHLGTGNGNHRRDWVFGRLVYAMSNARQQAIDDLHEINDELLAALKLMVKKWDRIKLDYPRAYASRMEEASRDAVLIIVKSESL